MKKNMFTKLDKEIKEEMAIMEELIKKREHEIWDWKVATCPAKWFYELTDKERKIVEESYKIATKVSPSIKWKEFIDLLMTKIH